MLVYIQAGAEFYAQSGASVTNGDISGSRLAVMLNTCKVFLCVCTVDQRENFMTMNNSAQVWVW